MKIVDHLYSEPLGHAFCGARVRKGPFHTTRIPAHVTCKRCRQRLAIRKDLLTEKNAVLAMRSRRGDTITQLRGTSTYVTEFSGMGPFSRPR